MRAFYPPRCIAMLNRKQRELPIMADQRAKARAAEYVDAEHQRAHGALKASHQKWERHELNHHMGRINSIKENKAVIDARYVSRMQTIENKKASIARIIDRPHKSSGGRQAAPTPKGRARQAETWQRLDERAHLLEMRAGRKHQMQLEQHHGHVQAARVSGNRDWMGLRGMNRDALVDHHRKHIEQRPDKIHTRTRERERAKLVELRPELKHQWTRAMK